MMAGARPEYLPVILAMSVERHHGAVLQHDVVGDAVGRQWPDP